MDIIESFFREYDHRYNDYIYETKYGDVELEVSSYVNELCKIPITRFLSYIVDQSKEETITARDVFQFSDIDDATINVCKVLKKYDHGLDTLKIGKALQNDGINRNDEAYRKYGENHIKTAEAFGLAFINGKKYYISGLGYEFLKLSDDKRQMFFTRLILRNKLIKKIYKHAYANNVDLEVLLYDLSESTYKRRRSNVKAVINALKNSKEYDFSDFANKITY